MKKKLLIISLILLASTLFASPRFGYYVSGKGATFSSDYGGVAFGLNFEPFPYGIARTEASVTVGVDSVKGFSFTNFDVGLSTPVFYVLSPFDFLFTNKMIWAPTIKGLVSWNANFDLELGLALSVLHFEDPIFRYDFLSPFILTNKEFNKIGWGIEVLKVSYTF